MPSASRQGHARPHRIGSVNTAEVATDRRSGISGLRFHDLQRSVARSPLENGAASHDGRDLLGHTDITTTWKSLAATPVRLREAPDRMEGTTVASPDPAHVPVAQPPAPTSALVN